MPQTAAYPRMCSTVSLPQAPDLQEGLYFDTKTFANETSRQATSTQQTWKLHQGRHQVPGEGQEEREPVGREGRVKTAHRRISSHRTKCGLHLQQLQQSLPIQNWVVQPQQALWLNHRLTPWSRFHGLPRLKDANKKHRHINIPSIKK